MTSLTTKMGVFSAAAMFGLMAASTAQAAETKSFVISWFYPSVSAQGNEKDCPKGNNPDAATNVIRILKEQGKSPAEVEKLMEDFPHSIYKEIAMRGRIDGKPVSPYVNPTSVPDPNLLLVEGKQALGFNLDGDEKTGGFTDPTSGEKGVDNQLFRAYGCTGVMRAEPNARPTWTTIQWQTVQLQMPAWLIEVSGIDDMKNDADVEVRVVQATRPVILDANSEPQADMTFVEDNNPVTKSKVHGSIKNGVLTTDAFTLALNGHRWAWSELRLNKARVRLTLGDDGKAKGIIAGYHKWMPLYLPQAEGGAGYEGMLSMDLPGMYYAFRKLADAEPDPKTGLNTAISTAFSIEAVPAFIQRDAQTAAAK
ncbi:MAG: hypothetical protein K2P94_19155 [Rhodospirillaceae bacterium]|nr:hypothetical protein [Rhodospirillaceae bacterium]